MANQKIDKLTPEQEAKIPVYRNEGLKIGLSTGETDRLAAMDAIKALYKFISKDVPEIFIFVRSPFEAQIVGNELMINDPDDKILNSWNFAENDEWVQNVIKNMSNKEKYKFISTHNYGYGSNETFWIQFYKFFRDECGVKYPEKSEEGLNIFDKLATCSGWHFLFDKCAIICDRPVKICMENNVLSCDDGPAVEFADGRKIYALGGHVVPEQVIMAPDTLTHEQIEKEENAETKRIMIDRYGPSKYMTETGAEIIDMDSLTFDGSSPRSLIKDKQGNQWLIGTDGSTGRVYHMAVPADVKTCREAHQAISGVDENNCLGES